MLLSVKPGQDSTTYIQKVVLSVNDSELHVSRHNRVGVLGFK